MAITPARAVPFVRSLVSGAQVSVARQLYSGHATCYIGTSCRHQQIRPLLATPHGTRTYLSLQYSGVKSWEENKAKGEAFDRSKLHLIVVVALLHHRVRVCLPPQVKLPHV